jgi:aspartate ammonia-lyase
MMNNAFKVFGDRCVNDITVSKQNMERIRNYVENSTVIATGLTSYIGYKRAENYAIEAYREGTSVLAICLRDENLVSELGGEARIREILNPDTMTRWGDTLGNTE